MNFPDSAISSSKVGRRPFWSLSLDMLFSLVGAAGIEPAQDDAYKAPALTISELRPLTCSG